MPVNRRNLIVLCLTIFLAAVGWNQIILLLPDFLAALGPNVAAHMAEEVPRTVRGRAYGLWQAANTHCTWLNSGAHSKESTQCD